MDSDGEPRRFLDYELYTSRPTSLSRRVASFPNWHSLWSHYSFDVDSSLLIGSDDCFSVGAALSSESQTQSGCTTTDCQLKQGKYGARLVRCETWSFNMATNPTSVHSEGSVVQEKPTVSTDESCVATFIGEESTETQNVDAVTRPNITSTSELGQRNNSRQYRLLYLRDLIAANTDYSLVVSAIKSFDQLVSGRRGSKDDTSLAREEFRQFQNDAQFGLTQTSHCLQSSIAVRQLQQQNPQTADSHDESKFFGLPRRITVSKREINMMSPSSF